MTAQTDPATAQTQPLTVGTAERGVCEWDSLPNERLNLWTIGNVSEIIPGVMLPLTATLYQQMDYRGTTLVADRLRSRDLVPTSPPPVGNFIACFGGRAVLNIAWAGAIIQTFQVGEGSKLLDQYITSTDGRDISSSTADDQARAARTFALVMRIWRSLPRAVAIDRRRIDARRAEEPTRDLSGMSETQLWRHAQRLLVRSAPLYARHLLVSGAAGEYTQWLAKLLDRALPDHDPALVIALTSALRDVESARPGKAAWDISRLIVRRKALLAEVESLHAAAFAARIAAPKGKDWHDLAEAFTQFIADYGFRGQREADPSAADWAEEPAFAFSAIRACLHAGAERDPHRLEDAAARRREAIEADALQRLPRAERGEYRRLLAGAQRFTRLRESSKANWVRATRPIRPSLRALAQRFLARGVLRDAEDFWYLLANEVAEVSRGTLAPAEAQRRVAARHETQARLEGYTLPEVFSTPVALIPLGAPTVVAGEPLLGLAVSAGQATGRARVVLSAEAAMEIDLEPGEILVAPYTDAPWTPLFVPAAAVVVETGGILSHAATVAREFGIPAVVAVKGATRLIETGQLVRVDGDTGKVSIVG